MLPEEIPEPGHQPQAGDADRGRNRHRSRGDVYPDGANHLLQLPHGDIRAAEETLTFRRKANRAMPAHQQFDAEHLLERAHLTAHRRLG